MSDGTRYRRIFANDWHNPAFRRLNDSARVVFLYVKAGPQTTSSGCFRLSTAVAVEDLGGTAEAFEELLQHVCKAFGWAYDPLSRVVFITDWFESNPPASPNVVHSWAKLLKNVPDCGVKVEAINSIGESLRNLPATFREPWRDLLKTFPRSESQPQVRPETNQGSGSRDQRTESREQASGREGNGHDDVPIEIRKVARKAVAFCGAHDSPQSIAQEFWRFWNMDYPGEKPHRDDVTQAINLEIADVRARQRQGALA